MESIQAHQDEKILRDSHGKNRESFNIVEWSAKKRVHWLYQDQLQPGGHHEDWKKRGDSEESPNTKQIKLQVERLKTEGWSRNHPSAFGHIFKNPNLLQPSAFKLSTWFFGSFADRLPGPGKPKSETIRFWLGLFLLPVDNRHDSNQVKKRQKFTFQTINS
jgi:hypothetical protein